MTTTHGGRRPKLHHPLPEKRTMRIDEAARCFGISRRSIYNYIRAGKLFAETGPHNGWRVLTSSCHILLRDRE